MPKTSRTSVIITSHNYGSFLKESIQSVLNQSVPPKQILVINDASTDNTETVAFSFGDAIEYFSVDFKNAQKTRNFGLAKSRGKYVFFLDADDYLRNDCLEKMEAVMEQQPDIDLVYSDRVHVGDEDLITQFGFQKEWKTMDFSYEDLRINNFISLPSLIRRKSFEGFDENIQRFQDWDAWLNFLADKKAFHINQPLFFVRFHGNNKTIRENAYQAKAQLILKYNLDKALMNDYDGFLEKITQLTHEKEKLNYKIQHLQAEKALMETSSFWKMRGWYMWAKHLLKN